MKNCVVNAMTNDWINWCRSDGARSNKAPNQCRLRGLLLRAGRYTTDQRRFALGAVLRESSAAVFSEAAIVYIAVGFDPEVIEICRGENGLLSSGRSDGVVVVNSTCDPELMIELGDEFAKSGIEFLDIPLVEAGPQTTEHYWRWLAVSRTPSIKWNPH